MKLGPITQILLLVALVLCAAAAVAYIEHVSPGNVTALMGFSRRAADTRHATPTPSPVTLDGPAAVWSVGTVSVQTFVGPSLVRSGTGVVVSSDGLILTTGDVALYASGSAVYQIATARGGLLRARRVGYDGASGLVVLLVSANDLTPIAFSDAPMQAGDRLTLAAAGFMASHYTTLILSAAVVYTAADGHTPAISFDQGFSALFSGSRVIDASGRTLGILKFGRRPILIEASVIEAVLNRYLTGNKQ